MGDLLHPYVITQESDWAGRRFCIARDPRSDQMVYLVGEPVGFLIGARAHPNLPSLKELGVEDQVRWWVGALPVGDKLEDLRLQGNLTESELLSALLSVVDALQALSGMVPPPVPAYLDPACVVRDPLGRWVLDYIALSYAPEARAASPTPLGVHAFGVLLYWVVTGETVRRARVQVSQLEPLASPGLQLMIIRCLGRSYPSLAELRAELSRAGKDREFGSVVQRLRAKAQTTRTETLNSMLRGPYIPLNDRPWATPPSPRTGYTRASIPVQQYRRPRQAMHQWLAKGLIGLILFSVAVAVAMRLNVIPPQYLPAWMRPATPVVMLYPRPEPVPIVHPNAQMEAWGVLVYLNGEKLGEANLYASPNYPYMALPDLNRLLKRNLSWAGEPNGHVILKEEERTLPLATYEQVGDTLWIKLLPSVQDWLGLRFQSFRSGILHFSTKA